MPFLLIHLSPEVMTVLQGHVGVRWQGHEAKPEQDLSIITQLRQARALGLPGSSGCRPWSGWGQVRVSLALRFLNPSPPRRPSLSPLPMLQLRGLPFLCPPRSWHPCRLLFPLLPRASSPHPSSPPLLPGPAGLLSLLPNTRWVTASTVLHPSLNSLLLLDLPP